MMLDIATTSKFIFKLRTRKTKGLLRSLIVYCRRDTSIVEFSIVTHKVLLTKICVFASTKPVKMAILVVLVIITYI